MVAVWVRKKLKVGEQMPITFSPAGCTVGLYQGTRYHSTIGAPRVVRQNANRDVTNCSHFQSTNRRYSMNKLTQAIKQFWHDEQGMGAVEYALIVAIMAVAITTAWGVLSGKIGAAFNAINLGPAPAQS